MIIASYSRDVSVVTLVSVHQTYFEREDFTFIHPQDIAKDKVFITVIFVSDI